MNVGDLVVVTKLGMHNPTCAEVVPFVGKIYEKDAINYWVRSEVTNKEYQLYPYQISPFIHNGVMLNPEYDGTNSYLIVDDDFINGVCDNTNSRFLPYRIFIMIHLHKLVKSCIFVALLLMVGYSSMGDNVSFHTLQNTNVWIH